MPTQISHLLLSSLRVYREIVDAAGDAEADADLGKFFGHINAYSLLLIECISHIQHGSSGTAVQIESFAHPILKKFTRFLPRSVKPDYEDALPASTQFRRLETLVHYWGCSGEPDETHSRILGCLDFSCREERDETVLLLRGCVAMLQPQHDYADAGERRAPRRKRKRAFSAWIGANTVFQALAASSQACSPAHNHDYAARLRLATHRQQENGQYEFDAFVTLSLACHLWQETRIHATVSSLPLKKKGAVRFLAPEGDGPTVKRQKHRRLAVEILCEQIEKLKSKPLMRLNLAVEDGKLWKDQSSRIEHPINRSDPPLSLRDIIQCRPASLTEKVKRVLAVLLAYSVLHLHGTPWLRSSSFNTDNILFFGTSATTPLKPYLHAEIQETDHDPVRADEMHADVDPDDLPSHPYPAIVMLAIMLMELYIVQPVQSLADQVGMEFDDWDTADDNTRYLTAIATFDRFGAEFPDNYREAVDRCLDPNIGYDQNDEELSQEELKRLIYDEIVQPLEDELDQGFGNTVQIDKLDEIAQTMDLSSWGQMRITQPRPSQVEPISPPLPDAGQVPESVCMSRTVTSWASSEHTLFSSSSSGRSHQDYTVGWICALPKELAAAQALLDEIHPPLPQDAADRNTYTLGRMGLHNVVMACLPAGVIGTVSAARVANNMLSTFRWLRFGLMVGIGGGVPGDQDVRLGDVVVGEPTGPFGGVIQYDFGKTVQNGEFLRTGSLNRPPDLLLTAISRLKADHYRKRPSLEDHLGELVEKYPDLSTEFSHPGIHNDVLFASDYDHDAKNGTCQSCDSDRVVERKPRVSRSPYIHYGLIASGNQVMRNGRTREKLKGDLDVICFEMEAAGVVDVFPCLVIRGICDYSDSHKNKRWQGYAAVMAAAYAKELLGVISGSQVDNAERLENFQS